MGVSPSAIEVTGNLKSRIIIKPPAKTQRDFLRRSMNCNPDSLVITAGCVHQGEASVIREALIILNAQRQRWQCVVVPRHLEKTPAILEELGEGALHAKTIELSDRWNICLIEKLGILEDMYMIADAAVIGGTFVPVGGHNVWEAVQFGIPVFFGTHHHKQQQSYRRLLDAGVGLCVDNAKELAEGLKRILGSGSSGFASAMSVFMESVKEDVNSLERYIP
jgi:3-deoxy-D-manno-octulosonic-acid transferase